MKSTTTSTSGVQSHRRLGHSLPTVCCLGGQQSPKSRLRRRVEPLRQLPGRAFALLSSCDRHANEAPAANRRAASPEFRVAAPWLPGRVRSSEISTGAFLLLLLAVHRSKAGFFWFFFVLFNGFAVFFPSHPWDARRQ